MTVQTVSGATIGFSTTLPTTFDTVASTGYPSLTFTAAANCTSLPEFGQTNSLASASPIDSTNPIHKIGTQDFPEATITFVYDEDDTGQGILEDNVRSEIAIEITDADGAVENTTGIILNFTKPRTDPNSLVGANVTIKQTRPIVRTDAT